MMQALWRLLVYMGQRFEAQVRRLADGLGI